MITTTDRGGIRILGIAHGKANTLDLEFFRALDEALTAAEAESVKALTLTGSGTIFSAGVDLFQILNGGEPYIDDFLPAMSEGFLRLFSFPKPVVAAVNGHAIAGGCILACACDVRIGAGGGRIGVPELAVGVPFPASALEIVRSAVGERRLPALVREARTYAFDEAHALGLLDRLVEPDTLIEEAVEEARRLASIEPSVFALSKRQLRQAAIACILREQAGMDQDVLAMWKAPETRESIRRYLERTLKK